MLYRPHTQRRGPHPRIKKCHSSVQAGFISLTLVSTLGLSKKTASGLEKCRSYYAFSVIVVLTLVETSDVVRCFVSRARMVMSAEPEVGGGDQSEI